MPFDNPVLNLEEPTYRRAIEDFLLLARRTKGVTIRSYPIPGCDERGAPLSCYALYWGPKEPKSILVADWAIHGIEGFAGLAQCYDLITMAPEWLRLQPEPVGILVVGPINGYGMVERDRFNPHNVDLNRNFLPEFPLAYMNVPYKNLEWAINPKSGNPESKWSVDEWFRQGGIYLAQKLHGFGYLVEAVGCGQGLYPKGVQYAGNGPESENATMRAVMRGLPQSVRRIVWVNLHNGLGPYGEGNALHGYGKGTPEFQRVGRFFGNLLPKGKFINTNPNNLGAIDNAVIEEIGRSNPEAEVTTFAYETGTHDIRQVVMGVRARTWARNFGHAYEGLTEKIKKRMLHLFFPADPNWRRSLRNAGIKLFGTALLSFLRRREKRTLRAAM